MGLVLGPLVGLKTAIIGKGLGVLERERERERERESRNQRDEVLGVFIV